MSDPRDPMGLIEKLQRQEGRHRMGETVALDRYGAMVKLLPQRMSKDPVLDRVLREAAPGYELEDVRSGRYYPDAVEGQLPPPKSPFFDEKVDPWASAPGDPLWHLMREPIEPEDEA